ncbi:DUF6270 domain-containing protein [Brachybacterium tyrofermentans]|uniref:DUF6270 domain-containing protein n=1 Tax=Brachybacterium tyrofermentans TaxID=47848 RepID=UPI003D1F6DB8
MAEKPAGTPPVRVAIYGSCVARDAVDLAGGDALDVSVYVARQSLISAGHDASALFPEGARVESAFQRRMMESDFAGDLSERLDSVVSTTDLLLWDLTDERHGVHVFADGTVVTRSIDVLGVPEVLEVVDGARHIPFGSDEHFDLWATRAEQFRDHLRGSGMFDRTIVLQIPWALVTSDGRGTPWSMGTRAIDANEAYRRYYDHLRDLGFTIFEMQPLGVLADPEHRWGLAPFHYTQDVYEEIVAQVLAAREDPVD